MDINDDLEKKKYEKTLNDTPFSVKEEYSYPLDYLLTDPETTAYLRLAGGTLPIWRHLGKGPRFIKLGRSVRYRYSDILEYLNQQRSNY
jgi:predicted DNA-binding transcriptional regulator AlpA